MRIYVYRVEDTHGNTWDAVAEEGSDTIHVSGMKDRNGKYVYFESEAYHLYAWAEKHGIKVVTHTIDLRLDERSIANWVRS